MKNASTQEFGKVAVVMGGKSGEREISLRSGRAVHQALLANNVDAHMVDADINIYDILRQQKFERVFIALHGCGGEDGTLQGGLETIEMPYTGSGVMASSICMNKIMTKCVWKAEGVNSPAFVHIDSDTSFNQVNSILGTPFVIKPSLDGSSLGIHKVETAEQFASAVADANKFNGVLMAEKWISGKEYTVAILQDAALPAIRLETPRTFYDYAAKYEAENTQYIIPCGLGDAEEAELKKQALHAFNATGAYGWGRVDVMIDDNGDSWFLEVNTVPGMTDHSLVPMAAAQEGIDFNQLVVEILSTSNIQR